MRYRFFEPPDASSGDYNGPSQEDLLTQIEADHYAAKQADDKEQMKLLDTRYERVKAAGTDEQAYKVYTEHVNETNGVIKPVEPGPAE